MILFILLKGIYFLISIGCALRCLETHHPDEYPFESTAKDEPKEIECSDDEDRCINVTTSLDFTLKVCSKIEDLGSNLFRIFPDNTLMVYPEWDKLELKEDECKKIPTDFMNPIKAEIAELKLKKINEKYLKKYNAWETFEAYTICTCSSDLCNGGIRFDAEKITVIIFSFIMSMLLIG